MKIVYMGTPDFATEALEEIIKAGHEVLAAVTQPDRPKGRSGALCPSPVKVVAEKYGIPVFQPERIRTPEAVAQLRSYPADIYVVAAFGQILTEEILNIPKYGCINIHASLLPHLRGASPIQTAILDGDTETGVTIMQMDAGVDTGDILLQERIPILDTDTGGSLFDKLSHLGAQMIVRILPMIEAGEITRTPQDESKADRAGMLKKSMGEIDFGRPAAEIERRVRGLDPWPGAYTYIDGRQLKLKKVHIDDGIDPVGVMSTGTIIYTDSSSIYVLCGEGVIAIDELQPEGKRSMKASDYLNGRADLTGVILGRNGKR